jgi:hypothetical protein
MWVMAFDLPGLTGLEARLRSKCDLCPFQPEKQAEGTVIATFG